MTTTISFELAKLLKEKGFDEPCLKCYLEDGCVQISSGDEDDFDEYNHNQWDNYSAPTITEVVMWLYEKHGVWISVDMIFEEHQTGFWYCIRESKDIDNAIMSTEYKSPEEAYIAAILYCLKNLIRSKITKN